MAQTVAILYGLGEGSALACKLIRQLESAGFKIVSDASKADLLIARSGGCFLIPKQLRAQQIILVGYPSHRGLTLARQLANKVELDAKARPLGQAAAKAIIHAYYLIVRLPKLIAMARSASDPNFATTADVTIIYNSEDVMSHASLVSSLAVNHDWKFVTLPGQHDDIWDHPATYVGLIAALPNSA